MLRGDKLVLQMIIVNSVFMEFKQKPFASQPKGVRF